MRLLVVKTSSLGDVIHTLAPLSDALRALPALQCDWLVEEAYRDVPAWHPGVRRVIPCALRRWRRAPLAAVTSGEWSAFRADLRREQYDLVLDAQGLLKSALLAWQAHGALAGRDRASAREKLASLFYQYRIPVPTELSEVEQLRELFARALGYARPDAPADFGMDPARFGNGGTQAPYAVFVHSAGWPSKLWPEERWQAAARELAAQGIAVKLPWGTPQEQERAQRIAAVCGGEVLPALALPALARLLAGARLVLGLDTGLTHLAVALGARTLTLYGPTIPVFDRVARGELVNLCSTESEAVETKRPNTVAVEQVIEQLRRWGER